jgi:WD40 repeat protein
LVPRPILVLSAACLALTPVAPAGAADKDSPRWQHESSIVFVAFTQDGKHVLTATYEGTIRKWDAASGKVVQEIEKGIKTNRNDVRCRVAALSPDGKLLAVATYASYVNVYNVATGKPVRQIKTADDQLSGASAVLFTPNSKSVLTGRLQGRVLSQWDATSGKELRKFGDEVKGFPVFEFGTLSISADGKVVASIAAEVKDGRKVGSSIRRWDLASGKELSMVKPGEGAVVFSTDGKTAALGDPKTGSIRLWDLEADKEVRELEGAGSARVFSRDGKLLAGRDNERILCVWDVQAGKVLRKIGEPAARPLSARADVIAFSADGKRIMTGVGTEVQQWDVGTGKEILPAEQK